MPSAPLHVNLAEPASGGQHRCPPVQPRRGSLSPVRVVTPSRFSSKAWERTRVGPASCMATGLDDLGRRPRCGPHWAARRPLRRFGFLPGLRLGHPRPDLVMDTTSHSFSVPRTAPWWSAGPLQRGGAAGHPHRAPRLWAIARILHPEVPAPRRSGLARGRSEGAPTAFTSRARRAASGPVG